MMLEHYNIFPIGHVPSYRRASSGKLSCDLCSYESRDGWKMKRHIKGKHVNHKVELEGHIIYLCHCIKRAHYHCFRCGHVFINKNRLERHVSKPCRLKSEDHALSDDDNVIKTEDLDFKTAENLITEIQDSPQTQTSLTDEVASEDSKALCEDCGLTMDSTVLKAHIQKKHKQLQRPFKACDILPTGQALTYQRISPGCLRCTLCSKEARTKWKIVKHIVGKHLKHNVEHEGLTIYLCHCVKPSHYHCPRCNHFFRDKNRLKIHLNKPCGTRVLGDRVVKDLLMVDGKPSPVCEVLITEPEAGLQLPSQPSKQEFSDSSDETFEGDKSTPMEEDSLLIRNEISANGDLKQNTVPEQAATCTNPTSKEDEGTLSSGAGVATEKKMTYKKVSRSSNQSWLKQTKVVCEQCGLTMSSKNLKAHLERRHKQSLHQPVKVDNDIFLVASSKHTPYKPLHVTGRTLPPLKEHFCENKRCNNERQAFIDSGRANYLCPHSIALMNSPCPDTAVDLKITTPPILVAEGLMSIYRAERCLDLHRKAFLNHRPLLSVWPYFGATIVASIYTGEQTTYSMFERVRTAYHRVDRDWMCSCNASTNSCTHRAVLLWYLVENDLIVKETAVSEEEMQDNQTEEVTE